MMDPETLFAVPRRVDRPDDCEFYHTMEVPGLGLVQGWWDLRDIVDQYLGNVSFAGKRVLEIGPASGFLTVEMEKRGASVVAVEVPDEPGWDFVPYPNSVMAPIYEPRRIGMTRIKNSFWFMHAACCSKARLLYTDAYRLPDALGSFDVAVMGAVLLHCHSPLQIVEQCAKRANSLVIAERFFPDLEGSAVCRLVPTSENKAWDTWWEFSTDFLIQFLRVMGFTRLQLTTYREKRGINLFTLTSSKE
jgi:SAM-dependent methyltransferase